MCMCVGKHAWHMYILKSICMQADMHEYVGMYICMYLDTHV